MCCDGKDYCKNLYTNVVLCGRFELIIWPGLFWINTGLYYFYSEEYNLPITGFLLLPIGYLLRTAIIAIRYATLNKFKIQRLKSPADLNVFAEDFAASWAN